MKNKPSKQREQNKRAEVQLPLNLACKRTSVSQSCSLSALENIKRIIKKPVTTRGSNCDKQK
jgi:hypothetical protein